MAEPSAETATETATTALFTRTEFDEEFQIESAILEHELWTDEGVDAATALANWCLARFNEVWGGRYHSYHWYVRSGAKHHRVVHTTAPQMHFSEACYYIHARIDACVFQWTTTVPLRAVCAEVLDELSTVRADICDPETHDVMVRAYLKNVPANHRLTVGKTMTVRLTGPTENHMATRFLNMLGEIVDLKRLEVADAETQSKTLLESGHQLRKHSVHDRVERRARPGRQRDGLKVNLVTNDHDVRHRKRKTDDGVIE